MYEQYHTPYAVLVRVRSALAFVCGAVVHLRAALATQYFHEKTITPFKITWPEGKTQEVCFDHNHYPSVYVVDFECPPQTDKKQKRLSAGGGGSSAINQNPITISYNIIR